MNARKLGQLALAGLLPILLAACAREQVKESPVAALGPVVQMAAPTQPAPTKPTPATALRTEAPKPLPVNPLTESGNILSKRSIYYAYDNYTVEPEYQPMLKAHAGYLRDHPGAKVVIEGNCDERGSREYNVALGQRRADAVEKMMVLLGASAKQIEAVSFGEEKPKGAGHDESSWSQNRRSDVVYRKEQ